MSKYQLRQRARMTNIVPVAIAFATIAVFSGAAARANERSLAATLRYEIVATHPHDTGAFTQGLLWHEGKLVESTGGLGHSALLLRELRSTAPLVLRPLPLTQFGEGVAGDGRRFVQLTWRSGIAYVYDLALGRTGQYAFEGEGWGLAFDGQRWLMSDGSSRIVARDRASFAPRGGFEVTDHGRPVTQLNELEFANGRLFANVWHTDRIAVIDPDSGAVEAWLDLSALRQRFPRPAGWDEREHVLNGIAFNPRTGHFFVTGKCWPVLYEIRLRSGAA